MLRIKEICKERKLRLYELAAMLDMRYNSLHSILGGNPKLSSLIKIAEALDVPITELFSKEQEITFTLQIEDGEPIILRKTDLIDYYNKVNLAAAEGLDFDESQAEEL